MVQLDDIRVRLSGYEPELLPTQGRSQASVAIILREDEEGAITELLFIERARRQGDPWSGHMAFPGGRREAEDRSAREAAERETHEEVGLPLDQGSYLGRIDDLTGRPGSTSRNLVVSAHVYEIAAPPPLVLSDEVEEAFWFPLAQLHDYARHVDHPYSEQASASLPGIVVGAEHHIVWGLTYRFLEIFFGVVGRPLPERWSGL